MKLLKKLALGVLTSVFVLGAATVATDDRTKREAPVEAAVVAGTYTFDFVTNFGTYAASWGSSYTSHSVTSSQLGEGLPNVSFYWTAANKQSTTITDRPVSKAATLTVKLLDPGFAITHVGGAFKQWTTKAKSLKIYEGETNAGAQLYNKSLSYVGGEATVAPIALVNEGISSVLFDLTSNTSQVGYTSVTLTIAEFVGEVQVTDVVIDPNPIVMPAGRSLPVELKVYPDNATDPSVTWSLTNVNPAGAVTFDTATQTLNATAEGTAVLTARANDGSGMFDTTTIEIVDAYSVTFTENGGTAALAPATLQNHMVDDGVDMTVTASSNIYRDDNDRLSLKFGTSSANGSFTFTLPEGYAIDRAIVQTRPWAGETSKISVNGQTAQTVSNPDFKFFSFDTPLAPSITVQSTGRLFLKSIYLVKRVATDTDIVNEFVNGYLHPEIPYTDGSDTGDCVGYYSAAKNAFNGMTLDQRTLFATDATYADPLARLEAWARANGDELDMSTYVLTEVAAFNFRNQVMTSTNNILLISFGIVLILGIGSFLYFRRRRHN
jgi:LPXTG-motif cell wall-anchored protein